MKDWFISFITDLDPNANSYANLTVPKPFWPVYNSRIGTDGTTPEFAVMDVNYTRSVTFSMLVLMMCGIRWWDWDEKIIGWKGEGGSYQPRWCPAVRPVDWKTRVQSELLKYAKKSIHRSITPAISTTILLRFAPTSKVTTRQ
jgi:hypothetical protein